MDRTWQMTQDVLNQYVELIQSLFLVDMEQMICQLTTEAEVSHDREIMLILHLNENKESRGDFKYMALKCLSIIRGQTPKYA
jgi:hypothetical protein